jgi:cobaltochelatase CobS
MATPTFSSILDEELMKDLESASELAGIRKPKPKTTGPKKFDFREGFSPLTAVIPLAKVSLNIPIRVFKREDWPAHMQCFIPAIDPNYVFDPEATLAVVAELFSDRPRKDVGVVLAHGPKGSGKTTLGQQICARINMPWLRVNGKEDAESAAYFGTVKYDPVNGMGWVDGPVTECAIYGGLICCDEVSRNPSGINASLMGIAEKNSNLYLGDKPGKSEEKYIVPHEWFRMMWTDNTELQGDTTGKYVGTNVQDEALIDRVATTIRLGYLAAAHEVAVITGKHKGVDNITAQKMVQLAGMIRQSYDGGNIGFTMSPRGLLEWAEKIEFWDDNVKAFKLSFWNKLIPSDQTVVQEFFHTVFAVNLR